MKASPLRVGRVRFPVVTVLRAADVEQSGQYRAQNDDLGQHPQNGDQVQRQGDLARTN